MQSENNKIAEDVPEKPWDELKSMLFLALSSGGVQAMTAIVGICTVKFVAPLGENVLAAVTSGQRLYFLLQALLLGLNVGTMALVARSWGAGDHAQATAWLRLSLLASLLLTIPMAVMFWIKAGDLLHWFGLDAASMVEGVSYTRCLTWSFFAIGLYLIAAGALRACGQAWVPLVCGVVLNTLTIFLTYWLLNASAELPITGAGAVAVAAGAGNLMGLLLLTLLLRKQLNFFLGGRWSLQGFGQLWRLSYPAALEQLVRQAAVLAFLWIVVRYGTAAFAAYGAGIMLMALSFVFGMGFAVATAVKVGQAIGNDRPAQARRALKTGLVASIISMSLLGLGMGAFSQPLAQWLVGGGEVGQYTATFILVFAWIQPVMAIDFVLAGALQGSGDTRWPLYSVILGPLVVRFGLAMLLLAWQAPVEWIFATLFFDYVAKAALLAWRVRTGPWPYR